MRPQFSPFWKREGVTPSSRSVPTRFHNPFPVAGTGVPQKALPMFGHYQIDHFVLHACAQEVFRELRRRIVTAGDGVVTDMGLLLVFSFTDPDGADREAVRPKPGVPVELFLSREQWETVVTDKARTGRGFCSGVEQSHLILDLMCRGNWVGVAERPPGMSLLGTRRSPVDLPDDAVVVGK